MKSDSNKAVKIFPQLSLKSKIDPLTPNPRTPLTTITNTVRTSRKTIFNTGKDSSPMTRSPIIIKKPLKVYQTLFSMRPRSSKPKPESPTSDLNDLLVQDSSSYEFGRVLGQGAYAVVRLATNLKENKKFAIKSYSKEKLQETQKRKNLRREIQIMRMIQHQGIVKIVEAFKSSKQVHIVLEYFKGMALAHFLKMRTGKRIPEDDAKVVFGQIVQAVSYLHEEGIAHRDIKLDNILVNPEMQVKIIDFGFSSFNELASKSFCGTPNYMAPEIIMRKEYVPAKVDVWALGVVLFVMLSGTFPFKGITDKDLFSSIREGLKEIPDVIPISAKLLISKMMAFNPNKRPAASDILKDSWLCEKNTNLSTTEKICKMCRSPSSER